MTEPLKKEIGVSKQFNYSKGNTHLNFTLSTSKPDEIRDFLELLKQAIVDVESELSTIA